MPPHLLCRAPPLQHIGRRLQIREMSEMFVEVWKRVFEFPEREKQLPFDVWEFLLDHWNGLFQRADYSEPREDMLLQDRKYLLEASTGGIDVE